MRSLILIPIICAASLFSFAQNSVFPSMAIIGTHTFFDFGPPFDFYEIYILKADDRVTSLQRITLTPAGDKCLQPAKVESVRAQLNEPLSSLLENRNPCDVDERRLKREMRRKTKSGLVFSGANLSMQVSCAGSDRVLALKVLDQDWFDQAPDTPQNTSWTMRVLSKLNAAAGPGVMDRPVFPVSTEAPAPALTDTDLSGLATGVYDKLFLGAPHKPSELLAASRKPVSKPSVQILSIDPVMPDSYATPDYPPIARVAHLEGTVTLTLAVEQGGRPGKIAFVSGIPILRFAVENSVKHWQFPDSAIGKEISVSIAFNLNCSGAKSP